MKLHACGQISGYVIQIKPAAPIRDAALPPPMKTKEKVEQGKGTADHLMPLGGWFSNSGKNLIVNLQKI